VVRISLPFQKVGVVNTLLFIELLRFYGIFSPFGACQPQAGGIKGDDFISDSENKSYYVFLRIELL
jgi:hypothetical protein